MQEPVHLLLHARRRDPGGGRLRPDRNARRGGRHRRRVGLRQVDRGARDHAVPGQERPHHVRRDQVQGPRHDRDERAGAAPGARLADRDGLPGADGLAQSVDEDRTAADGGAAVPRGLLGAGRLCARPRHARRRAPARSQADHGELSAPDLGRAAAARGHRHGAPVEPGAAAPGRADHRARRHGRSRHRRADQGHQRALRHLDDLHLAQSRPDPRDLRSHHGHVLGRGGRGGHGRGGVRPHAPPLHQGAVQLDPAARRRQERAPAGADPRPAAAAARAAGGLQLRAALRSFPRRGMRSRPDRDGGGAGPARAHEPLPAYRGDRLEHRTEGGRGRGGRRARPGRAQGREPEEVLRDPRQLADGADPRRAGAHGQGQREARLRCPRGRDRGDRRRIGLRQVDLRQDSPRPRDRDRGQGRARQPGPQPGGGAEAAPAGGEPPADDLSEPVRHAQPEPQRGRSDRARDPEVRRRAGSRRRCASG